MTTNTLAALKKLRAVTIEFFDAVELELRAVPAGESVPAGSAPAGQVATRSAPVPRPPTPRAVPAPVRPKMGGLPQPLTPAPNASKAALVLDEATRAANLPSATEVAKHVIRLVGATSPNVVSGVKGQLALKHIAHDDQLITDAIAAAKA